MAGRGPVRTCVGCRRRGAKRELVRLARSPDGAVLIDAAAREPGRGAYVHRDPACLELALGRGSLARALRVGLPAEEAARLRNDFGTGTNER